MGLEFACLRHCNQLGGNRACECEELCQLNCLRVISIAASMSSIVFCQFSFANVPHCWSPKVCKVVNDVFRLPYSQQFDFPMQLIGIVS
jgi:hypothetical protein